MEFNRFVWSLYCESAAGKAALAEAEHVVSGDVMLPGASEYADALEISRAFEAAWGAARPRSQEGAAAHYEKLLARGVPYVSEDGDVVTFGGEDLESWVAVVGPMSAALSRISPELFTPYGYQKNFQLFARICREFDIPLPELPGKASWDARATFYIGVNDVLQEFRHRHGLSPSELCAFLHHFAPTHVRTEDDDLPPAGRVWFLIGGAGDPDADFRELDDADEDTTLFWQGNVDTRRGDICIMWCVRPRSYVHSIWRAQTDGFVDPFFHYHSAIFIGNPVKVPHVSFKELAADPVWSQKPEVRAHLQGSSGKPVKTKEYEALTAMLTSRGHDGSTLPTLNDIPFAIREDLANERDVETHLIEPLLQRLGYRERDWVRQLPIRMGRGERVYPDYVIGAVTRRGEESAHMIVEAKFRLDSRKELEDAYFQAKSYALRLQAGTFVLAAREGVWVFQQDRRGFSLERALYKNWTELERPEEFRTIESAMGKSAGVRR